MLSSLIGGLGSMVGSMFTSNSARKSQQETNDMNYRIANENNAFAKSESELAFNRQQQQIAEQNEYNSPAAQMARYKAAGINPNAIAGQISPGAQSQTASYNPAQRNAPDLRAKEGFNLGITDGIQTAAMMRNLDLDIEAKKYQNDLLKTQADAAKADYLLNYGYGSGTPDPNNPNIDSWRGMQLLGKTNSAFFKSKSDMYGMASANHRRHILSEQKLQAEMKTAQDKILLGNLSKKESLRLQQMITNNAMNMMRTNLLEKDNSTYYPRMVGNMLGTTASGIAQFMPWMRAPLKFK